MSAPTDQHPASLSVRVRLGLLFIAHLALVLTPKSRIHPGIFVEDVLSDLRVSQYCLLATAIVLPTAAPVVRAALGIMAVLLLCFQEVSSHAFNIAGETLIYRLLEFTSALAVCLILRKSGLAIRRLCPDETNLPLLRLRFHLSDLLMVTAIFAIDVAYLKTQLLEEGDNLALLILFYATSHLTLVFAAFLALWSALGRRHLLLRFLIAVAVLTVISVIFQLGTQQIPSPITPLYAALLLAPTMLSLLVVRWCGYRLAPRTFEACAAEVAP